MKKTKENKGITLITIIISIILMTILVSVVTYSGIENYKNAKVTKFVAEMQLIQAKVDELVSANEYLPLIDNKGCNNSIISKAIANDEIPNNINVVADDNYKNEFYLFTIDDLKDEMDLENIDTDVLINFNTREVVSVDGVEYEGNTYYTQYKLPQAQTLNIFTQTRNENITFPNPIKELDGLNCLLKFEGISTNCTLTYGELDTAEEVTNLKTITNYTKQGETYFVNITKSGTYIFKLEDNVSDNLNFITKTVEVITTNSPKTNYEIIDNYDYSNYDENIDDWVHLEYEGNNYVWLPRFVYKYDENEDETDYKFIKGNSNISTDNSYIDKNEWTLPDIFSTNSNELTGIWVKIDLEQEYTIDDFTNIDTNSVTTLEEIKQTED